MGVILKKFKKVSDVEDITKTNIEMKKLESQGDEIHLRAIDDLFSGKYDAFKCYKTKRYV